MGIGRSRVTAQADAVFKQIAIIPFPSSDGDKDTATLGDEIVRKITNRLNGLQGLMLIDQRIIRQQAKSVASPDGSIKADAGLILARKLNADTLVTGAYKKSGANLELECSIVDVQTGQVQEGKSFKVTEAFPSGYPKLLADASEQIEKLLRPAAATASRPQPIEEPSDIEPHQLLSTGLRQASSNTKEGLTAAKESFDQAIHSDPSFADAYAAKSDAEHELSELKLKEKQDATAEEQDSVKDALEAVKRAPYSGDAHWQLSRALTLVGDYENAALAARIATVLWPANGSVEVDLSRAIGHGKIAEGPELQSALQKTPTLFLAEADLPKVTIVNGGLAPVQVKFTEANGTLTNSVRVPPAETRIVGMPEGSYTVTSTVGEKVQTQSLDFGANTEYAVDGRTLTSDKLGGEKVGFGTMIVSANVPGARITIDGIDVGTTPAERVVAPDLKPTGTFIVQATAEGYKLAEREVHPKPGSTTTFKLVLVSLTGEEKTDTTSNANIRVNPKTHSDMVLIPAGDFTMGDSDQDDNKPHTVTLKAYLIGRTPVTIKEFRAFTEAKDGYVQMFSRRFDWNRYRPTFEGMDDHPMENVDRYEARAYCRWAGGDLPTEAQWEHAARGPENTAYPWGNAWDPNRLQWSEGAWGSTGQTASVTAHPKGASGFGCLDMAGNVCQWCLDGYQPNITNRLSNPLGEGPAGVARGGSRFYNRQEMFRSSCRISREPRTGKTLDPSDRYFGLGFRVAMSAGE